MEILQSFGVDWKLLLAQLINFTVVVLVLWFFAIKPLGKVMAKRNQEIEQGLADAKKSTAQLEQAGVEFKAKIREAKQQAEEILQKAKEQSLTNNHIALAKTRAEAQAIIEESKKRLVSEKELILAEVKQEAGQLIIAALEKILDKSVDHKLDHKYVQEVLKQAGK